MPQFLIMARAISMLILVAVVLQKWIICTCQSLEFNKEYVGTVFEPYTKYEVKKNEYNTSEVESMLQLVSRRFKWVSTYGMGTISSSSAWNEGDAAGLSAVAASKINQEQNSLQLILNIGTWINYNEQLIRHEINNAFTAANKANANYAGTVNGIIISAHHTSNSDQIETVVQLLKENVSRAKNASLQLGIRSSNCDALINPRDSLTYNNLELIREMINHIDFIYCQILPSFWSENVATEVQSVGDFFIKIKEGFIKLKSNLIVIGETGWPSFDMIKQRESNGKSTQYLSGMGHWANINEFRVDIFTAFDEPWKAEIKADESHFGWWKRVRNDSSGSDAFVEKINKPDPDHLESPDNLWPIYPATLAGLFLFIGVVVLIYKYVKSSNTKPVPEVETDSENNQESFNHIRHIWLNIEQVIPIVMLGKGSFATVYKAREVETETEVAVKIIALKIYRNQHDEVRNLFNEVDYLKAIRSSNVVAFMDWWAESSSQIRRNDFTYADLLQLSSTNTEYDLFIQMELCESSLYDWLRTHETLEDRAHQVNIRDMFLQILRGLEDIHKAGIVHRDIKPANILYKIDSNNRIIWKFTDFGLSRKISDPINDTIQLSMSIVGNKMYRSPEIYNEERFYAFSSDVFSLGLIFLEVLHPISNCSDKKIQLFNDLRRGHRFHEEIELSDVWTRDFWNTMVSRMLIVTPDQRLGVCEAIEILTNMQ